MLAGVDVTQIERVFVDGNGRAEIPFRIGIVGEAFRLSTGITLITDIAAEREPRGHGDRNPGGKVVRRVRIVLVVDGQISVWHGWRPKSLRRPCEDAKVVAQSGIGFHPGIGSEIAIPDIDIADDAHRCVYRPQGEIVVGVKVPFEGRVIAKIDRRDPRRLLFPDAEF